MVVLSPPGIISPSNPVRSAGRFEQEPLQPSIGFKVMDVLDKGPLGRKDADFHSTTLGGLVTRPRGSA